MTQLRNDQIAPSNNSTPVYFSKTLDLTTSDQNIATIDLTNLRRGKTGSQYFKVTILYSEAGRSNECNLSLSGGTAFLTSTYPHDAHNGWISNILTYIFSTTGNSVTLKSKVSVGTTTNSNFKGVVEPVLGTSVR